MSEKIRIYVGSAESHSLLVKVLEHSIKQHSSQPVDVIAMGDLGLEFPTPKDKSNRPATPFSLQRFAIPELANFSGRAIYMDSDQVVTTDVAELFNSKMWGRKLLRRSTGGPDNAGKKGRSSVMLLNCDKLDWRVASLVADMDAGKVTYHRLITLRFMRLYSGNMSRHWNALDHYEAGKTALLHFTKRDTQPWLGDWHPHGHIWFSALYAAMDDGFITDADINEALEKGYVRPSMGYQVAQRITDSRKIPELEKTGDAAFFDFCRQNNFNNLEGDYRSNTYEKPQT